MLLDGAARALMQSANAFGLSEKQATQIAKDVRSALRTYETYAARAKLAEGTKKQFSQIIDL